MVTLNIFVHQGNN